MKRKFKDTKDIDDLLEDTDEEEEVPAHKRLMKDIKHLIRYEIRTLKGNGPPAFGGIVEPWTDELHKEIKSLMLATKIERNDAVITQMKQMRSDRQKYKQHLTKANDEVKKLRKQLEEANNKTSEATCCVCLENTCNVYLKDCKHTVCSICLPKLARHTNRRRVKCPKCRQFTRARRLIL